MAIFAAAGYAACLLTEDAHIIKPLFSHFCKSLAPCQGLGYAPGGISAVPAPASPGDHQYRPFIGVNEIVTMCDMKRKYARESNWKALMLTMVLTPMSKPRMLAHDPFYLYATTVSTTSS